MVNTAVGIASVVAIIVAVGDLLHHWRSRRIALLAFPGGTPRAWTAIAPFARIIAAALLGWGLTTLVMTGPNGHESRASRARDILRSILSRIDLTHTQMSIVALYNGAKPVVIDTIDPEVVRNVLEDLPLDHAFTPGKTTLYDAIATCNTLATGSAIGPNAVPQPWPPGQAHLIIVSDGDSAPPTDIVRLPSAFAGALVIGVGDASRGLSIDGHLSRQESSTLHQLAGRFGGHYFDGNRRHLPTDLLAELFPTRGEYRRTGLGDLALVAVVIGSAILAFLPALLDLAGAPHPVRPKRNLHHAAS